MSQTYIERDDVKMMEEWKVIQNYKNYSVSNLGNIKNNKTNKILKPNFNKQNYAYVWIKNNDNICKRVRIHRLVAQEFIPNRDNKSCVNHLDYNPSNNCLDNLEWVTYQENTDYSREHFYSIIHNYKHSQEKKHEISLKRTNFNNELGHHIYKHRRKYIFKFMTNGNKISKSFNSLEEAIKYRDDYLNTIGYYNG